MQVHPRSAPLVAVAVRQAPLLRTLVLFFLLQRPCSLARVCIVYFVLEVWAVKLFSVECSVNAMFYFVSIIDCWGPRCSIVVCWITAWAPAPLLVTSSQELLVFRCYCWSGGYCPGSLACILRRKFFRKIKHVMLERSVSVGFQGSARPGSWILNLLPGFIQKNLVVKQRRPPVQNSYGLEPKHMLLEIRPQEMGKVG